MFFSRILVAAALAAWLAGCGGDNCTRNSDCPAGDVCSAGGACLLAPDLAPLADALPADGSAANDLNSAGDGAIASTTDGGSDGGDGSVSDGPLPDGGGDGAPDLGGAD